uniref:Uncharacterized protein n=1 Tax=Panagrolaimus sp. PS1159 TaxID=55785 RepID=A0AC35FP35_9BILA
MDYHKKLHPPISTELREAPITLYVSSTLDPTKLYLTTFDVANENVLHNINILNISEFFNAKFCSIINAVIFNMFELQHRDFNTELKRQETLIELLRQHGVPHVFMRTEEIFGTMSLINAEIVSVVGEIILCVCVIIKELIVLEMERKSDGYYIRQRRDIDCENETNFKKLKKQILGSCKLSKIIVSPVIPSSNKSLTNLVREKILQNEDIIVIDNEYEKNMVKFITAIVGHIFDKVINEWHIFPRSHSTYAISTSESPASLDEAFIVVHENETLPLEKSIFIPRSKSTFYVTYINSQTKQYEKVRTCESPVTTKFDFHKIKLSFIIDENNIPFLYQQKVNMPEIEALPTKLNKIQNLKIPVIAFFDNSAVICIKKDNEYKFLESLNRLYGGDIFVSFNQEKPVLIPEMPASNNSQSVLKASDIFKIMSVPCENIIVDEKWNFEITSNDENPVLLAFKNFDGTFIAASPALIMAIIIKQFLKIIKKEIGVKVENIGILHFDKFDDEKKKKRIQSQLQEACSLLKLDCQIL